MVDRIYQQTTARGARPSSRFAQGPQGDNAATAIARAGYDFAELQLRRTQADAEVESYKAVTDDILALEQGRQEALQNAEAGAKGFTQNMSEYFNKVTKKRKEIFQNEFQREAYDRRMQAYRIQFVRQSAAAEQKEAERYTVQTLEDSANNTATLFDGYDYTRIQEELPVALEAQREAIINSPLSVGQKEQLLDQLPQKLREAAVRSAARKAPMEMAESIGKQYKPDTDGIVNFILEREGGLAEIDGASGAPALFGINRRSFPEKFDEVMALYESGQQDEAKKVAAQFYKEEVIQKNNLGSLPNDVALVVADGVVNHRYAIQQKLIKEAKDGATAEDLLALRQEEYDRLRATNPQKYADSYMGWMNRLKHVEAAIGKNTDTTGNPIFDMAETPEEQQQYRQIIESERKKQQSKIRVQLEATAKDNLAQTQQGMTTKPLPFEYFEQAYGDAAELAYREYETNYTFSKTLADVSTATPDEMQQMLIDKKPKPGAGFAQAQRNYQTVQSAIAQEMKQRVNDPMQFAIREGFGEIEPLNFNDTSQLAFQLSTRNLTAQGLSRDYQLPYQPLTNAEVEQLKNQIPSMTEDQQIEMIEAMQEGFGDNTAEAMAQFAGKDDIFAHIGGLLAAGGSKQTVRDILRGREYAAANPKAVDKTGIDKEFAKYVGGAMESMPEIAAAVKKSADNLYYIRAMQQGKAGVFDTTIYRETIDEVLGHNRKSGFFGGSGAIHSFNNQDFVLPVGISADQFDDRIDALQDDDLKAISLNGKAPTDIMGRKVTAKQIREYGALKSTNHGEYVVYFPSGFLMAGDEPYIVKFN
jgi:lysozyme family protein